ncbi:hypothetical protein [Aureisphaera sp.]
MILDYLIHTLPITLLELLATIAGFYFLKKSPANIFPEKYFVQFLLFTVIVELIGSYAPIAYFEGYNTFSFLKDTPVADNKWLYNIYSIVSGGFFAFYFAQHIKNKVWKKLLFYIMYAFVITSIVNLLATDVFFTKDSRYSNIVGTFVILLSVILFYFDLLRSDKILNIRFSMPVYVSIGVVIFYLSITPITIFSEYFSRGSGNSLFVEMQSKLILYSNIFMYSCFILGFLICSRKKKFS